MKKVMLLLLSVGFMFSCGESQREKDQKQAELIKKETAKILVVCNKAIAEYKSEAKKNYDAIKLFKFNDTHIAQGFGLDWEQKLWDKTYEKYKLKDLKKEFKQKFGEDEYNILSLKINEYFDKKMN